MRRELNDLIYPVGIACLFFGLGLILCDLPFLADDYFYLWRGLAEPNLGWTDSYTFARMPVSTLLTQGVTKSGLLEHFPAQFLFVLFAAHAAAVAMLIRTFLARAFPVQSLKHSSAIVFLGAMFSLQPNNYEIHLWHYCALHSLGALAMAYAFRRQYSIPQVLLVVGALLTYDSFFLMLLGCCALWYWARPDKTELRSSFLVAACAIGIGIATKIGLREIVGTLQVIPFELSAVKIVKNCEYVFRELFSIHFYKVNWPLTIAHGITLTTLVWQTGKFGLLPLRRLMALIAIPILSALPLAFNSNPAPRSYYGPQLLQVIVLAYLVFLNILHFGANSVRIRGLVFLFAVIYAVQWVQVFKLKDENAKKMQANENVIIGLMERCQSPCVLPVPNPEEGLKRDFILPQSHWVTYYERLRLKNYPQKKIQFVIAGS